MLLAGLSASMSILRCDLRSERLFDVTESVLGIGISGESPPNRTFHPWRSKCPYRRLTRTLVDEAMFRMADHQLSLRIVLRHCDYYFPPSVPFLQIPDRLRNFSQSVAPVNHWRYVSSRHQLPHEVQIISIGPGDEDNQLSAGES